MTKIVNGDNIEKKVNALKEGHKDLSSVDLLNQCLDIIREEPELAIEPDYGDLIYQVTIPIEPKTKKNHQRILKNHKTGKNFIAQGSEYKQYENKALWFLRPLGIDYPVNIQCVFYRKNNQRVDLSNLISAIMDILVKKGTIKDDSFNIAYSNDGSRVFVDKDNPRTEIYIYKIRET